MKKIFLLTVLFLLIGTLSIFANDDINLALNPDIEVSNVYVNSEISTVSNSISNIPATSNIETVKRGITAEDFLTADNILTIILITIGIVIILLGIAIFIKFK